jgi:glycosyltransferase involved in cell wall biosynthesis
MKLLLIGEAPLPYGGITSHCVRLLGWLRGLGHDAILAHVPSWRLTPVASPRPDIVPCRNSFLALWRLLRAQRPALVHLHVYRWRAVLMLAWARQGRFGLPPCRVVATVHGEGFFAAIPGLVRPWVYAALRQFDQIVADNPMLQQRLETEAGVIPARIALHGAFLPPDASERNAELLPADVRAFMASCRPLLATNGAMADFRGDDKYGFDLVLQATARLAVDHPQIGLVACVTDVQDAARWQRVQALVGELGLTGRVRFVRQLPSFLPVLQSADASVRATNTDGDALSVHESLLLGTPVVASDVVVRPPLADRFRNRDVDDLVRALAEVLARGRHPPEVAGQVPHNGRDLLAIYERLLA